MCRALMPHGSWQACLKYIQQLCSRLTQSACGRCRLSLHQDHAEHSTVQAMVSLGQAKLSWFGIGFSPSSLALTSFSRH